MVTNGTVSDPSSTNQTKENGEVENDTSSKNEYSSVKPEESMKPATAATDKSARAEHNDMPNKMSTPGDKQNFSHGPASNGFPPNSSYNNAGLGNGGTHAPASTNGPQPNGPYSAYGPYPHGPQKQGASRPNMHSIPPAYMPNQRYPSPLHGSGAPQSLGQLLSGPTRFTGQYPNYSTHGTTGQTDYSQNSQQSWSNLPPQYARPGDQTDSYNQQQQGPPPPPQQQQHPAQQQHYSQQMRYLPHPSNLPRYSAPPPSTASSYQPHQVQHGSVMAGYPPPPVDGRTPAGYPPNAGASGYAGYPPPPPHNHMQPHPPYYPAQIRQPTTAATTGQQGAPQPNQQHPYPAPEQNSTSVASAVAPSQPLPAVEGGGSQPNQHQTSRPNSTSSPVVTSSSNQPPPPQRMMSPSMKPQTPNTSQPSSTDQSPGPSSSAAASTAAVSGGTSAANAVAAPSSSTGGGTTSSASVVGGSAGATVVPSPGSGFPPRHHMPRQQPSTPGTTTPAAPDAVNSPAPVGSSTAVTPVTSTPQPSNTSGAMAGSSGQVRMTSTAPPPAPQSSVQTSSAVQQLSSMVVRPDGNPAAASNVPPVAAPAAPLPAISSAVSMPAYGSPYNRQQPGGGYQQMHAGASNYPQHVSPMQQQPMYGSQSHPGTPRPVMPMRPAAPVAGSGGKPHQMNNYNSQPHTPQSAYSPAPQAYNTASPVPQPERRLSKQGSNAGGGPGSNPASVGVVQSPESQQQQPNRQGAAQAAAAAAIAAAAHTANNNSQGAPVPGAAPVATPNSVPPPQQQTPPVSGGKPASAAQYYPGQQPPTPSGVPPQQPSQVGPHQQPQQRVMTRPGYGPMQPGSEQPAGAPYQQLRYPQMPPHPSMPPTSAHASGMPRMPGHPGMSSSPGVPRMQPHTNMYNHGYGNQHPSQAGPYPGYYPPGTPDPHHPRLPSYPTHNSYPAPSTPAPEEPKKVSKTPQARSASQKLAALYEPRDEPGRHEFISRVLKYWEDKNLPLKNAPLMGRKTLDLYLLYRLVKERGFMQEVTNQKKWNEISSLMKLNTSNTSGFTLKKQYCKYLYGYECRFERGEEEPQEALSRITEANRKKKNHQSSAAAAAAANDHSSSSMRTANDDRQNSNSNTSVGSVSSSGTPQRLPSPMPPRMQYQPYPRYPSTPQPPSNSHGYVVHQYGHPNMTNSMSPKPPQMYPSQPLPSYPHHGQPVSTYPGGPPHTQPGTPGPYPQPGPPPMQPGQQQPNMVGGPPPQQMQQQQPMMVNSDPKLPAIANTPHDNMTPTSGQPGGKQQGMKPMMPTQDNNDASSANKSAVPTSTSNEITNNTAAAVAPTSSVATSMAVGTTDTSKPNTPTPQQHSSSMVKALQSSVAAATGPSGQYKMPPPPPSAGNTVVHPPPTAAPPTPAASAAGHMPPGSVGYQPRPNHDPYQTRPYHNSHGGMPPPSPFPYANHSTPQQRQQMHPTSVPYHHTDMRRSPYQSPGMHPGYAARPGAYSHQQPGYPVPPQQPGGPSSGPPTQSNLKRPGPDMPGQPPNKYPRPEGMPSHYNQANHMRYPMMMRGHHPSYGTNHQQPVSTVPPSSMGMPPHQQQPGSNVMSRGPGPAYPHPSIRPSTSVGVRPRMRWRPPGISQSPLIRPDMRRQHEKGLRLPSMYGRRSQPMFPPGCVEATEPKIVKFQRKTCRDVGNLEAWRVIMSLKSGLLVESTWALNVLTILLYDNQTVHQFKLSQLPGLLDSLVDHYRRYLAEFFTLTSEREALGVTNCDPTTTTNNKQQQQFDEAEEADGDEEMDVEVSNLPPLPPPPLSTISSDNNPAAAATNEADSSSNSGDAPKSKNKGGRKKQQRGGQQLTNSKNSVVANGKLSSKYTKLPVKLETAFNNFVVDKTNLWDHVNKLNATDDLSHIVVSFLQEKIRQEINDLPDDVVDDELMEVDQDVVTTSNKSSSKQVTEDDSVVAVEATLEDVLSIPTSLNIEEDLKLFKQELDAADDDARKQQVTNNADTKSSSDKTSPAAEKETRKSSSESLSKTDEKKENKENDDKEMKKEDKKTLSSKSVVEEKSEEKAEKSKMESSKSSSSRPSSRRSSRSSTRSSSRNNSCDKSNVEKKNKDSSTAAVEKSSVNETSDAAKSTTKEDEKKSAKTTTTKTKNSDDVVATEDKSPKTTTKDENNKIDANKSITASATTSDETKQQQQKLLLLKAKSKIERVLEQGNVVLLESEAIGDEGNTREKWAGATLATSTRRRREEIATRLNCVCNIIRSLSFLNANSQEIFRHRPLMRAISGVMLIRHKHRTLSSRAGISSEEAMLRRKNKTTTTTNSTAADVPQDSYQLFGNKDDQPINEYSWFAPKKRKSASKPQETSTKSDDRVAMETTTDDDVTTSTTCCSKQTRHNPRRIFSSTVLDENENTSDVYKDTWWWNHVRRMREDAMVILCNITQCVDLSQLPDDHTALAMLEACLHWSVCPSSEASDPFNSDSQASSAISPQNISLEILTKLSMRDQNVDLILAMRPYSRIEKLFSNLINLISRKELALREFSFVLLCNLAAGDVVAARAIALQKSSISTLISFLEECEMTGQHNSNLFSSQPSQLNCGTTPFMMLKCAKILLSLAKVPENRPSFIRYTSRLMDLSMSKVLREEVTRVMSSTLYEASIVDDNCAST